jgi:hypothetical protein
VKPQLKRLEVEPAVAGDDDLTIEHAAAGQLCLQWINQLGEVSIQRFLVAALNEDLVAVAEDERAKAIPLGLEDPSLAWRELAHALGEHG